MGEHRCSLNTPAEKARDCFVEVQRPGSVSEFDTAFEQLRTDLDFVILRHQERLQRHARHLAACQVAPPAPSNPSRSSSSLGTAIRKSNSDPRLPNSVPFEAASDALQERGNVPVVCTSPVLTDGAEESSSEKEGPRAAPAETAKRRFDLPSLAPAASWFRPRRPESEPERLKLQPGTMPDLPTAASNALDDVRQSRTLAECMVQAQGYGGRSRDKTQAKLTNTSTVFFAPLSRRKLAAMDKEKNCVQLATRSQTYELMSAVVIVLNAMVVVCETERRASLAQAAGDTRELPKDEWFFTLASNIFCVIFAADLALRIYAERWNFILSTERSWNFFDFFVVLTVAAETLLGWIYFASSSTTSSVRLFLRKFSMLRILRLLRVIRSMHAIRVIWFIRELRLMVFSLTGTAKSMIWSLVLLLIILLVFGVFFTDGAVTHCVQNGTMEAESTELLRRHFGSLYDAVISLFMAMSGGEDWGNILASLSPLPGEYRFFFLAFVTFAVLALLNVVTAIFVETAMQMSQSDKELVVMEEMNNKDAFIGIMHQVFMELDTNGSGALSIDEFEKHIEDEKITAFLRTLELDVSQVRTLFTLLDVDRTGEVDLDEFVSGCLRLKGGAKNLDMAIIKFQIDWILHNLRSLDCFVRKQVPGGSHVSQLTVNSAAEAGRAY